MTPALDTALLAVVELEAGAAFACPDCDGDPACSTCGEPTRAGVLEWLQKRILEELS